MELSEYQKNIFKFVEHGEGNGGVIAVAGSGKTFTAVESMKLIPVHQDVFFSTFTKVISEELGKRLSGKANCTFGTYNSFGWRICLREMINTPKMDEDKTDNILRYNIFNNLINEEDKRRYYKYRYIIKRIISLLKSECCLTIDDAVKAYPEIVDYHAMEVPNDPWFTSIVWDTYKQSLEITSFADWDDQKLFPVLLGLTIPQFETLFVDEFQDSNPLENKLILGACTDGRKIVIGDPNQSIYGFRGAKPDAMDIFVKENNAIKLPLYICYRCSKAVVREAQKTVPYIEYSDEAAEGSVNTIKLEECVKLVKEGDFVLCRTTAPLVKFCLDRIKEGKAAYVKGKKIGEGLITLIDINSANQFTDISTFFHTLRAYFMKRSEELLKVGKESQLMELTDKVDTLNVLMESCNCVSDLIIKVTNVFKEAGKGIHCMTCHRSKGLETPIDNDVFILRPDLLPHPKGNSAEEKRIKYVAITRCRRNLYYVLKEPGEK